MSEQQCVFLTSIIIYFFLWYPCKAARCDELNMRPQHTDFIIMLLRYGVLLPGNSTFFISRASLCPLATLYRDLKKKEKFILCISFKWKLLAFRVHWCVNDLIEVFSFSMFFASLVFRLNILSFNLDKQLRYNIIFMFLWKSLSSVNYIFWTEYKGNMFRINISQRVKMCSAL